ncbi:MAG: hypothetical protein ABGY75_04165 [Gemmataceae bacterium]
MTEAQQFKENHAEPTAGGADSGAPEPLAAFVASLTAEQRVELARLLVSATD